MSFCVTCNEAQPRPALSNVTTTVVAVITAMTFSASGAAPTPLYHQYQESFGLTPFAITVIFAAYVLSLLAALLTVGSLSGPKRRKTMSAQCRLWCVERTRCAHYEFCRS